MREQILAHDLKFIALGEDNTDLDKAMMKLGSLDGISALRFTIDCARRMVNVICQYAPALVRKAELDLLLVDQNEPAGATVAEHLGVPFLSVCSGLPLNRDLWVPPTFVDWKYSEAFWAKWRNEVAYFVFDRLVSPINHTLNFYRRKWGLPAVRKPDDTFSPLAQLCTIIPELTYPKGKPLSNFHYTGPMLDSHRPIVPFPYHQLNGKRIIYASLGTVQNRIESSFRYIADAAANLDAQLVISLGGGLNQLSALPGSPIVVPYAPQLELLSRASLCISHGGLNTIMEALSFGVPLLVVPITNDQPANARRVQWSGAGEYIRLSKLSTQLPHIVRTVLDDYSYRTKAMALAHSIRRAGGVEMAVQVVEDHLGCADKLPR